MPDDGDRSQGAGLRGKADPRAERKAKGGPPKQQQEWPGRERDLEPEADHGEDSYRGSGRLEGRKALITGGDSGIGRAVAIAFAREGADVCIAYYNEDEDARETMRWVREAGRRGIALPGDLADPAHCREVVNRTADELSGLDLLVNNAAVHFETPDFMDLEPDQVERTFRTNIFSFFWTSQAALEHMPGGGAIVNSGSVVALKGHPSLLDYAATKAAIHNFTRSLAAAVSERGIRVNCVAPGPVWTPLIASTREEEAVEEFGADTYWGRPAQPVELAPAYVFLASADARFISGEILSVSGRGQDTR